MTNQYSKKWQKSKNQRPKIKKALCFPATALKLPSLTTQKYKNDFIFWFGKTIENFEFSEKAH